MTITIIEEENNKYKIEPIKMANDLIISNINDPLPDKYGFFITYW